MITQSNQSWIARLSSVVLLLPLLACGETIDPDPGTLDTGGDDADTEVQPDPGPLAQGECVTEPVAGVTGSLHQCNGLFLANIGFTYDDQDLALYVPSSKITRFGQGYEPYEQPKVMACCGLYDPDSELIDQPALAENCFIDFRQQVCMSIAINL
ncbi:MAG: hypothetical protein KC431_08690, partial [Myxococcales bacterium]|nr:hypothetical protein [Myxococcales bacterium]